ncbi:unnamed protein product [Protopolystoma xenopodis]|uniref:Uncharacterized protein n=1 Tax=Protopolystoma xenopodis TaxID=117903 RepID=A0A448WFC0_9PLAT|nr:unnamed protein product [Protopolystoma xenopodis]
MCNSYLSLVTLCLVSLTSVDRVSTVSSAFQHLPRTARRSVPDDDSWIYRYVDGGHARLARNRESVEDKALRESSVPIFPEFGDYVGSREDVEELTKLRRLFYELTAMSMDNLREYVAYISSCCLREVNRSYGGGHLWGQCCRRMQQITFIQHLIAVGLIKST